VPDVFISYSRRDREFVERLSAALEAQGKDAWVDWEDIPASAQWRREIEDGIDGADAFLYVISPASVTSRECGQELDHALERRKRILPIVHREVDPAEVRPEAAAINWVYLRDEDPFEDRVRALIEALNTDLEHTRSHTRLATEAIDWERSGHERSRLLRGSELQEAERWLTEAAAKQPQPTELQAQFVQASREAARRRGRILTGGVALALVVAVTLAVVALIQRSNAVHQSQVAYSRQLDAEAQNHYSTDPELSVLLAMQGVQAAPGTAAEEALRQAMAQSHVRDRYTNPIVGQPIGDAVWSPDGRRLAIVYEGANRTEIVRPGIHAKPIVLQTPGLNNQISWAGHRPVLLTGSAAPGIWNGTTGALIHRLPTRAVQAAISPDGRIAATGDVHGVLHLWNADSGREITQAVAANRDTPGCLVWSPDGSKVAMCTIHISEKQIASGATTPETVTVFDAHGHRLSVIHEPTVIDQVAFSPDARRVALAITPEGKHATESPGTFVYDAASGARLLTLGGHPASAVAFNPDGSELAYAEILGGIVYVYSFNSGKTVPLVGSTGTVNTIQFSHTATNYVLTSSDDDTARVFSGTFGNSLEVLAGHGHEVTDATWSPDDSEIATASKDGTARVWATPLPRPLARRKLGGGLVNVALSPDGRSALVAGPNSSTALVLDSRTLAQRAVLTPPSGQRVGGGGFSPNGRWIGLVSGPISHQRVATRALLVYNRTTGTRTATIAPSSSPVVAASFGHGSEVATILANGQVDSWSDATGAHQRTLIRAGKTGSSVVYSSDGRKLAVTHSDGSIDILTAAGSRSRVLHGPRPAELFAGVSGSAQIVRASFSPDGRWLAAVGGGPTQAGHVYIWNLATGRMRALTAGLTPLVSLAFNSSGTQLAAGDASAAYVWRFPSGAFLQKFTQGASSTYSALGELEGVAGVRVGFTRTGTLITAGDFETRDWRISTGQEEFGLSFTESGASTPDASRVVADEAGTLGVYSCELCGGLGELMTAARHQVTRGLTPTERALYLRRS
jgi:WD40 repeat protein